MGNARLGDKEAGRTAAQPPGPRGPLQDAPVNT